MEEILPATLGPAKGVLGMRDKAAVKMTESPKATKKEADKKAPAKPAQDLNVDIRASKTRNCVIKLLEKRRSTKALAH